MLILDFSEKYNRDGLFLMKCFYVLKNAFLGGKVRL